MFDDISQGLQSLPLPPTIFLLPVCPQPCDHIARVPHPVLPRHSGNWNQTSAPAFSYFCPMHGRLQTSVCLARAVPILFEFSGERDFCSRHKVLLSLAHTWVTCNECNEISRFITLGKDGHIWTSVVCNCFYKFPSVCLVKTETQRIESREEVQIYCWFSVTLESRAVS